MSTKSTADKLLIKPSTTVWSSDDSLLDRIEPLPDGVRRVDRPGQATIALVFAHDASSLRGTLAAHRDELARPASLWVAYPKANRVDLSRDKVWPILVEYGMVPIGQVALDDAWAAMRFRALKEGEAPFTGGGR